MIKTFIRHCKMHKRAVKALIGLLIGAILIGLFFMLRTHYLKITESQTQRYDHIKSIEAFAKPTSLADVKALDPELEHTATIENRYRLFEYMDFESVEFVQNELDAVTVLYTSLTEPIEDPVLFYESHQNEIIRYMNLECESFENVLEQLKGLNLTFVLSDTFEQYESVHFLVFKLQSNCDFVIKCSVNTEMKTFVSEWEAIE